MTNLNNLGYIFQDTQTVTYNVGPLSVDVFSTSVLVGDTINT